MFNNTNKTSSFTIRHRSDISLSIAITYIPSWRFTTSGWLFVIVLEIFFLCNDESTLNLCFPWICIIPFGRFFLIAFQYARRKFTDNWNYPGQYILINHLLVRAS
jgi:hypothetical protein